MSISIPSIALSKSRAPLTKDGVTKLVPPGNPEVWLDATKMSGYAEGGDVTSEPNLGSAGGSFSNIGTAPVWRAAVMNGKPGIDFESASGLVLSGDPVFTQPMCIVLILYSTSNTVVPFDSNDGTDVQSIQIQTTGTVHKVLAPDTVTTSDWTNAKNKAFLWAGNIDGASTAIKSVGLDFSGDPGDNDLLGVVVGSTTSGGAPWNSYISEVLVYNSAQDLAAIEEYANKKYNLS